MAQAKFTDVLSSSFDTVITLNAGTAVTVKESVGFVVDTVRGIRKPNKDLWTTLGNYSEVMVEDSKLALEETKLENSAKLAGLKTLSKDEAYLTSIQEEYMASRRGNSSEIQF